MRLAGQPVATSGSYSLTHVGFISADGIADIYALFRKICFAKGRSLPKIMEKQSYWYILYVRSGKEQRVADDFKQAFHKRGLPYAFEPFCPESEYYYRNKADRRLGRSYRKRPLFSGYVFIETDIPPEAFRAEFSDYIGRSEDIIRLLRYGDTDIIALSAEEQARFEYLFRGKKCLDHSVAHIAGETIVVTAGPLVGREGLITHINRHNRIATIRVGLFGGQTEVKVALEIVDKR